MSEDMNGTRRDDAKAALKDAGETMKKAIGSSRDKVKDGYRSTRRRAHDAREGALDGFENNPLVALAGGLAIGGVVGALLPRSKRETELLAGVGRALNDAGTRAATAAREAGAQKLDELGISKAGAKDGVQSLIGAGREAAKSAGKAAGEALKDGKGERGSSQSSAPGSKSDTGNDTGPSFPSSDMTGAETDRSTGGATVLGGEDETTNFYEGDVAEGSRDPSDR